MPEPPGRPPASPPVPHIAADFAATNPVAAPAPRPVAGPLPPPKSTGISVLGIATVLLLTLTLGLVAAKVLWNRAHVAETKPRTRVVRLVRPIAAFSRIAAADVRTETATVVVPGGVASDPAKVVGRVITIPLDSGALLPARRLVDLGGEWVVLSVPGDSVLAGRAGDTISVLAGMSPDTAKEPVTASAVSLGTRGAKTYLAVRPADLQRFAAYYQKDARFLAVRRIPP